MTESESRSARQRLVPSCIVLAATALGPFVTTSLAACTLRTQWEWVGMDRSPSYPVPLATPLVLQLTDDNGDGRIGWPDVPDVVFTHQSPDPSFSVGVITALDGRDGSEIFTTPTTVKSSLAAGDLDGDGIVELVAFSSDGYSLVVFEHDGGVASRTSLLPRPTSNETPIGIADIDGEGSPEIFFYPAVHAAGGALRWQMRIISRVHAQLSLAVDLSPTSPGLEIVAGNVCYGSDGAVIWDRTDLQFGWPSVGDLDGDGQPEVVLVTTTSYVVPRYLELHVLDRGGRELGGFLATNRAPYGPSPATIADLDGDGRREVIVPRGDSLDAFKWTGTSLEPFWSAPLIDHSSAAGASVFDLDGDGAPEVLYRGSDGFHVVDGRDGTVLDSRVGPSNTFFETPVVADIDADGIPEIVVTGGTDDNGGSVTVYECGVPVPARCIWNQQTYHVTNVNDDGTIPRNEVPPWTVGLGWQEQEARPCCTTLAPPLPDVSTCEGGSTTLDATSLGDPTCPGGSTFEWRDASGGIIGIGPTVMVSPAASTTYEVTVDCPGQPSCGARSTTRIGVMVEPRSTPDLLGRALRASHVGDLVTMTWPTARALLPGEHFHVLKGTNPSLLAMINSEGDLAETWSETDVASRLQFFDVRIANPCEIVSLDDEPEGWDGPH